MRAPFRIIIAIGALLAAVPAGAQTFDPRYPVCMRVYSGSAGGGGDWYECSFTSLPQCAASTSGRSASCVANPYYAYDAPPARGRHKRVYD